MAKDTVNWLDDSDETHADQTELRYYIAGQEDGTWSVFDRQTNMPAAMENQLLTGMALETADDMLELMNQIEEDLKPRPPTE